MKIISLCCKNLANWLVGLTEQRQLRIFDWVDILIVRYKVASYCYQFIDKVYGNKESRFIDDYLLPLLSNYEEYGISISPEQQHTFYSLIGTGLFTFRQQHLILKKRFIHKDGYIHIDMVLVERHLTCTVITLIGFLLVFCYAVVSSIIKIVELHFLGYIWIGLVILIPLMLILIVIVLLATCFVYMEGVLPYFVAKKIVDNEAAIQRLGPRIVCHWV